MDPLSILDTSSFWSVWYWAFLIVAWSMSAHWTIGVPFDMLVMADRKGGEHVENFETMVRLNVDRIRYYFENFGAILIGAVSFLLSGIAVLGFYFYLEAAQAVFMLLGPLTIMSGFSVRFAYKVHAAQWHGAELRKRLRRRRAWNQLLGLSSIGATAYVASIYYLHSLSWY